MIALSSAHAIEGKGILNQQCASCHNLTGLAAQTVDELWKRLGPDLFQAGSKYKAKWLETWLTKPTRIRPAGYHAIQNIKPGTKRDVVDKTRLTNHVSLSTNEAKAVTQALISLKAADKY